MKNITVFIFCVMFFASMGYGQEEGDEEASTPKRKSATDVENPGGPEDDQYSNTESLPHKSGYDERPEWGSAKSVAAQLEEDDRVKDPLIRFPSLDEGLGGWFERKKKLNETLGFKLGIDYNSLSQSTNDSLTDEDKFWSGIFRVFGQWDLYKKGEKDKGTLIFQFNHRHNIRHDLTPADAPGQLGYIGVTAVNFSDAGAVLGDFYWKQNFREGNVGV